MRALRKSPILLLMVVVMGVGGCAASKEARRAEQRRRQAARTADRVREQTDELAALIPRQTKVLVRVEPTQLLGDLQTIFGRFSKVIAGQRARLEALAHLDRKRAFYMAVATTTSRAYLERAWSAAPVTDRDQLPRGFHVRLLLPSNDPERLRAEFEQMCDNLGGVICRRERRMRSRDGYLTVDMVTLVHDQEETSLLERVVAEDESTHGSFFDRLTPALYRFSSADAPVAIYAHIEDLLDFIAVQRAAELRAASRDASPSNRLQLLLSGQAEAVAALLGDPRAAEFEDVALLADVPAAASKPAGSAQLRLELVRTLTAHGRKVWASKSRPSPMADAFDTGIAHPYLQLLWQGPGPQVMDQAHLPGWARGERHPVNDWRRQVEDLSGGRIDPAVLFPLLEYPGGMLRALAQSGEAHERREDLAANLGMDVAKLPTITQMLGVRRLSVTLGVAPDGAAADLSTLQGTLVAQWPSSTFAMGATQSALDRWSKTLMQTPVESLKLELEATEEPAGQQLLAAVNTQLEPASGTAGQASSHGPRPEWSAHFDGRHLPEGFDDQLAMLAPFGSQIYAAGYITDTYATTRVQLGGDALVAPEALLGFDAEHFETAPHGDVVRSCLSLSRFDFARAVLSLRRATPENRPQILGRLQETVTQQTNQCAKIFPEQADRFRWTRGSWLDWQATQAGAAFDLAAARPLYARACELGYEPSCQHAQRLEKPADFLAPPPAVDGLSSELVMSDAPVSLVTPRGVFGPDQQLATSAEALRADAKSAIEALAKEANSGDFRAVHVVPDAMVDADLVARLAAGLQQRGLGTKLVELTDRSTSRARVFNVNGPSSDAEIPFRVHLGAHGIDVFEHGSRVAPVEGCADDGPTICLADGADDAAQIWASVRKAWADQDVDRAYALTGEALAAYRFFELYNVLMRLHRQAPGREALEISASPGLPAVMLTHTIAVALYEREQGPFDTVEAFRQARPVRDYRRYETMFSDPVLVPAKK